MAGRAHTEEEDLMRKLTMLVVVALLAVLLITAPASANPPERTLGAGMGEFFDDSTGTFILANISGEVWCDWALGGFNGDPPVSTLTEAMAVETGSGSTHFRFTATWSLEAFRYPTEPQTLEEECAMIESLGPWATGVMHVSSVDSDLFASGPGTASFGATTNGSLIDGGGQTHHFHRVFRAQIRDGDFFLLVDNISIQ
jgi:hypothetical protein